jgi:predicted negative regulator of RcsB-dependent stress response
VRDRLAQLYIEAEVLRLNAYRGLTAIMRDGVPGPEGSLGKWQWAEVNQALTGVVNVAAGVLMDAAVVGIYLLFLLLAVALGLAAVSGFKYWQSKRLGGAEAAELQYEAVIAALATNQPGKAAEQTKELRATHPKSPYTDQAELAQARAAVARHDYDGATRMLRTVIDGAGDPLLRQIARTRLARVTIEQGRYDDAVALLPLNEAGSFAALYHDVRGDALAAKGDTEAARREYTEALAVSEEQSGLDSAFVTLKRDALPAAASAEPASDGKTVAPPEPAAAPSATTKGGQS